MKVEYDAVIHDWLVNAVGGGMGVFCVEVGFIGSQDLGWLQEALNILISLFRRIGLMANVAKSKMMTCNTGFI